MDKQEVIDALNRLPEKVLAKLMNMYFYWSDICAEIHENTSLNLDKVLDKKSPSQMLRLFENAKDKYNTQEHWFSYEEGCGLCSANTVRELIPFYYNYMYDIASCYMQGELPDKIKFVVDSAMGKHPTSENDELDKLAEELRVKEAEERGENRLVTLLKTLQEEGYNMVIDQVIEDKEVRKEYYTKYGI